MAILNLVISRALLFAINPDEQDARTEVGCYFQSAATTLLQMLITKPARGLAANWEMLENFLAHEILDPNRHRALRPNYGKRQPNADEGDLDLLSLLK